MKIILENDKVREENIRDSIFVVNAVMCYRLGTVTIKNLSFDLK